MENDVPVKVVRVFRWRGQLHTFGSKLLMPRRTALHLLRGGMVDPCVIEHIVRYRCRLVRPVDHSTEQDRGVSNINGSFPALV
jgi:hypothetical protein